MTTATAFFLLALVYALVDAYNKWDGEPFIYAGTYVLSKLVVKFMFSKKATKNYEIFPVDLTFTNVESQ